MDLHLDAVAQHAGMVRQLIDEAVDRPLGAAGGPGFEPFAEQHDEHGLGGGQVLADRHRREGRDDDRQIGGNLAVE